LINNINVVKCHGKSSLESHVVDGFALQMMRSAQGMPLTVKNCKVACLGFDLRQYQLKMGVQVLVKNVKELEKIKQRERDITRDRIMKLIGAGANVIMTTGGIDDLNAKYLIENGVMGLRLVPRRDLRRIATATGATILPNLADLDGGESVEASSLGSAAEVAEETLGDQQFVFVRGAANTGAASVILRGANEFMLDEVDRSLHDALMVVKRTLESKKVVPGGGSVEAACHIHLDVFANQVGTREQLAIQEFANSLLVIPRTLIVNAAKDAAELVSQLISKHTTAQTVKGEEDLRFLGLDLIKGEVVDNVKRGVLEPALSKVKSLRFATEAAITILRIDDHIKINPKQAQDAHGHGH